MFCCNIIKFVQLGMVPNIFLLSVKYKIHFTDGMKYKITFTDGVEYI